jgi:pyridoxal phosphate enzyme (YggS family)
MQKDIDTYFSIREKIPSNVELTIVTKNHLMQKIIPLIEAGHNIYAENYIQEAKNKWGEILHSNSNIKLKFIGKLQSNKIKDALNLFHEIHSIDSISLAEKIFASLNKDTRAKIFYAQVNIGNEEQKNGITPENLEDFFEKCPLEISGLMCIPPSGIEPSPYFLLMQNLRKNIEKKFMKNLKISMGMSGDFEKAIALGSNEVRIGSAILGERGKHEEPQNSDAI